MSVAEKQGWPEERCTGHYGPSKATRVLYSYACRTCNAGWEASEPIAATPQTRCPHCGADEAYRECGLGNGFCLRGGGWAIDGYYRPPSKQVPHVRKHFPGIGKGKGSAR